MARKGRQSEPRLLVELRTASRAEHERNWVKVVQRIPIRVRIDETQGKPPLRSGMSAVIDIDTGHKRGLPFFTSGQAQPAPAASGVKSHG